LTNLIILKTNKSKTNSREFGLGIHYLEQMIPVTRPPYEIDDKAFCGYTDSSNPNVIIAPYYFYKDTFGSPTDDKYSKYINCVGNKVFPKAAQTVYSFRDSYQYASQVYNNYPACIQTLKALCYAHQTSNIATNANATTTTPQSTILVQQYQSNPNGNRNWFAFNATQCSNMCATSSALSLPDLPQIQFDLKDVDRNWVSFAMSADASVQTAVALNDSIRVSVDSGKTFSAKESVRAWKKVVMNGKGDYQVALAAEVDKVYYSSDYGNTWNSRTAFVPPIFNNVPSFFAFSISYVASTGITYVAALRSVTGGAELWISSNGGIQFSKVADAPLNAYTSVGLTSSPYSCYSNCPLITIVLTGSNIASAKSNINDAAATWTTNTVQAWKGSGK
jgi:hypothetical protein